MRIPTERRGGLVVTRSTVAQLCISFDLKTSLLLDKAQKKIVVSGNRMAPPRERWPQKRVRSGWAFDYCNYTYLELVVV